MINAIIIDDEKKAVIALEKMLQKYCPDVTVLATANHPETAIELIQMHQPDVIFLDIEMPAQNGFAMLDAIGKRAFSVIFTTAYDQHAVKAFRYAALDYLLKPISEDELVSAVNKLSDNSKKQDPGQLQQLIDNLKNLNNAYSKLAIPTTEGLLFINVTDIIFCQAESSYTTIYLKNKDKIVSSKTLKDYEDLLAQHSFYRVHHSFLINLYEVKRYLKGDGGTVVMNNGAELPVAKRKKDEFLKRLKP